MSAFMCSVRATAVPKLTTDRHRGGKLQANRPAGSLRNTRKATMQPGLSCRCANTSIGTLLHDQDTDLVHISHDVKKDPPAENKTQNTIPVVIAIIR